MGVFGDVGECVATGYELTLADWVEEYASKVNDPTDLLGSELRAVECKATVKPGGRLELVVTVISRRSFQDLTGFYRFFRRDGVWHQAPSTNYGGRAK
jgi:hypothetical protein